MTKEIKKKIDFIPLLVLYISAFYLLWQHYQGRTDFNWKHILGFTMLGISTLVIFINHKLGVLFIGFTIILGVVGILSFSSAISILIIGKDIGDVSINFFRFQPVFILWAIIHFLVSGRYYVGIAQAKYWNDIKSDEPFKMN